MVANDGDNEGLFRAAFMQSGSPIPVADITRGQKYFDDIVLRTGCSNDSDKLNCLRTNVSYDSLNDAIRASPGVFAYQVRLEN
jgi:acetylcholinesterase